MRREKIIACGLGKKLRREKIILEEVLRERLFEDMSGISSLAIDAILEASKWSSENQIGYIINHSRKSYEAYKGFVDDSGTLKDLKDNPGCILSYDDVFPRSTVKSIFEEIRSAAEELSIVEDSTKKLTEFFGQWKTKITTDFKDTHINIKKRSPIMTSLKHIFIIGIAVALPQFVKYHTRDDFLNKYSKTLLTCQLLTRS